MTITTVQAREHFESMRRTARRLVRNPADADDVVQEAMLRTILYVRDGRMIDNWGGYLGRVVRNVVSDDHARHARRGVQVDLDAMENELSVAPRQFGARQMRELDGAMAELPAQQRDVLQLVGIEGLSYQDAADRLGVPAGTVMSRLHRAREALRVRLSGDSDPSTEPSAAA